MWVGLRGSPHRQGTNNAEKCIYRSPTKKFLEFFQKIKQHKTNTARFEIENALKTRTETAFERGKMEFLTSYKEIPGRRLTTDGAGTEKRIGRSDEKDFRNEQRKIQDTLWAIWKYKTPFTSGGNLPDMNL